MGDRDELTRSYEAEKEQLLERIRELEAAVAEVKAELEAANERCAALEDAVSSKGKGGKEATKEQLEIVKLETKVKEVQRKADALRESLEREQTVTRDLRAEMQRESARARQLADALAERDGELAGANASLQRALGRYAQTVASLVAQLGVTEAADGLRVELVDNKSDPDLDPETEWPRHCENIDAALHAAVAGRLEQIAGFPAQLQQAANKALDERERLKARYETRVEQLKEKLARKDKTMAEFDGQLARLKAAEEELAQSLGRVKALEQELQLTRRKLDEQKEVIEQLRGQVQDQEHLRDVLLRHQDFRSSQLASEPRKAASGGHDCVTVDQLQTQMQELRRSFQHKLKEKEMVIASLQEQTADASEARRLVRLASRGSSPVART
jgi:chromosome segregation ATPase